MLTDTSLTTYTIIILAIENNATKKWKPRDHSASI